MEVDVPDNFKQARDRMAQLSDHELLAHIALNTDAITRVLADIDAELRQAADPITWHPALRSLNASVNAIAENVRLLRRELVRPMPSDWEER